MENNQNNSKNQDQKYCFHCGTLINKKDLFCSECGTNVGEISKEQPNEKIDDIALIHNQDDITPLNIISSDTNVSIIGSKDLDLLEDDKIVSDEIENKILESEIIAQEQALEININNEEKIVDPDVDTENLTENNDISENNSKTEGKNLEITPENSIEGIIDPEIIIANDQLDQALEHYQNKGTTKILPKKSIKDRLNNISRQSKIIFGAAIFAVVILSVLLAAFTGGINKKATQNLISAASDNIPKYCTTIIKNVKVKNIQYDKTIKTELQGYTAAKITVEISYYTSDIKTAYNGSNPKSYIESAIDSVKKTETKEIILNAFIDKSHGDFEWDEISLDEFYKQLKDAGQNLSESFASNQDIYKAVTDILIPFPFKGTVSDGYKDETSFSDQYKSYLDEFTDYFVKNGLKINGAVSNDKELIKRTLTDRLTPYLYSMNNATLIIQEENDLIYSFIFYYMPDSGKIDNLFNTVYQDAWNKNSDVKPSLQELDKLLIPALKNASVEYTTMSSNGVKSPDCNFDLNELAQNGASSSKSITAFIQGIIESYDEKLVSLKTKIDNMLIVTAAPASGIISGNNSGHSITISTQSGDGSHYLKIESIQSSLSETGTEVMTVFIAEGDTTTINLPSGNYKFKYASGTTWYGTIDMFGPKGKYVMANQVITVQSGYTYTLKLFNVVNGNLGSTTIGAGGF